MSDSGFDAFLALRTKAAQAYVSGDPAPLDRLVAKHGDASFHSPRGDSLSGAAEVGARYISDAKLFEPGGKSRLDILQQAADDKLAFWTGYQIATVQLSGQPHPIDMRIRVTEVFRRIGDAWKLVHRHADVPPAPGAGA
ncbi:YybH family protein [Burkholderia sp. F1]|uniref:YybH family protein n=1 Tax=Burkholderia sp. F1 TaxID=3366817 RepID=UPI003D72C713